MAYGLHDLGGLRAKHQRVRDAIQFILADGLGFWKCRTGDLESGAQQLGTAVMPQMIARHPDAKRLEEIKRLMDAAIASGRMTPTSGGQAPIDPARVAQLRGMAPPPMPPVSSGGVDPRLTEADQLTAQAAPPKPIQGAGRQMVRGALEGIASLGHPQGFSGYRNDQLDRERQRQQDLLERAKQLRGESVQQQELQQRNRQIWLQEQGLETDRQTLGLTQRNIESQIADRAKPKIGYGANVGTFDEAGRVITPPTDLTQTNPSVASQSDADVLAAHAAKLGKPVASLSATERTEARRLNAVATAQSRYDISDPARTFSQERQLRTQLLQETDWDQQRLQSYANLLSLGDGPLDGSDQLAVLYNFIRLMDPNRVSEGEIAAAQSGSQTAIEQLKAKAMRLANTPSLFSPDGVQRLRATAIKMGGGIHKRVSDTMRAYQDIATRSGLNMTGVAGGLPALLQSTATPVDDANQAESMLPTGGSVTVNPGELAIEKDGKVSVIKDTPGQRAAAKAGGYTIREQR